MDYILQESSQVNGKVYSVDIVDVGSGGATLYIFNGGTRPPRPILGDFLYDFHSRMVQVCHEDGWRTIKTECKVWHPSGKKSVMCFTARALPFWTADMEGRCCGFDSVEKLLHGLRQWLDAKRIRVSESPSETPKRTREGDDIRREKRPRLTGGGVSSTGRNMKDLDRFVSSSVGFPENMSRIAWDAGFETYMPFAGLGSSEDMEGLIVKELACQPSLERSGSERCGPEPEAFHVRDLVVELELDAMLRGPADGDADTVERVWKELLEDIKVHMSRSTSVVVRGWTPALSLRLSKGSMALQFGDLGMRCQWVDASILAANRGLLVKKRKSYHKVTSMQRFIESVEDPTTCGNFLDGKDLNVSPPMWAKPLLDSTIAWEHTMHLRFTQKGVTKKDNNPPVLSQQASPTAIRSATWTSQGWRLVTHAGFLTLPHHDCCGMGTYVVGNSGAKLWAIMRPKRHLLSSSLKNPSEALNQASNWSEDGKFSDTDIVTVCLEAGDVMFQPPGVLHCVYTPVPSIFSGGYFYGYETMHLTRAVLAMKHLHEVGTLTNDTRPGFFRTLCRMVIALRYRSEPRKIGKRSLISLLLIILNEEKPAKDPSKLTGTLAEEERGDFAFATQCAENLLHWLNMTTEQAEEYLDTQGAYYLAGNEVVEIPVSVEGIKDPIFPDLNGSL